MIDEERLIREILVSKKAKCCYCLECEHGKISDKCTKREISIGDLISIIEKLPKVGKWIPVSERLPEVNKSVLATYHRSWNNSVLVNRAQRLDNDWWELDFGGICRQNSVLAWMPSPDPYEKEGKA